MGLKNVYYEREIWKPITTNYGVLIFHWLVNKMNDSVIIYEWYICVNWSSEIDK